MVLTMKLTTFAWNVYDGRRPLAVRFILEVVPMQHAHIYRSRRTWTNGKHRSVSSNIPHYWPFSATRKLDAFGKLKKSLSHAVRENRFYFPGFLVGPYIDFASYASLIDETLFSSVKEKEAAKTSGRRVPKGRKRVAYRKMFIGLAFLGAYVTMIGTYSFESVLQPWFVEKTLVQRYFPRLF